MKKVLHAMSLACLKVLANDWLCSYKRTFWMDLHFMSNVVKF